ncbi:hypothetical protein IV38_GL000778 [Lactobacillus selangorensis]|uniref:ROK family protein n=1 Tax=Lactobacillus selangorensis TaxID=81857 RepID=A0A0R2FXB8_9LACO|nr:ROK family protein [Lactobacillus selangorensis]KRN28579.1 hypothetical protein IV38_GL000778 [Lactobacillus selangorensis]KRN33011.1 hypothetical protein IV40_GL001075 [Lactobacillus selangorensis]
MKKDYLSIDIGGTNIKYALIDRSGNINQKGKIKTPSSDLDAFVAVVRSLITKMQEQIRGITFSIPGKIDNQSGIVYHGGALTFLDNINFRELFGTPYNLPVNIENDGKSAALAELWLGNLNQIHSGVAIVLGTGVGGGIVLNNHLYYGRNLMAGEFSFILDNYTSDNYMKNAVGATVSAVQMVTTIGKKLNLPDPTDGQEVFQYINNNDPRIGSTFTDYCNHVAKLILSLQAILDVDRYVIGGGISAQPIVIQTIHSELHKLLQKNAFVADEFGSIDIKQAKFGNDANLFGALYSYLLQIDNEAPQRSAALNNIIR